MADFTTQNHFITILTLLLSIYFLLIINDDIESEFCYFKNTLYSTSTIIRENLEEIQYECMRLELREANFLCSKKKKELCNSGDDNNTAFCYDIKNNKDMFGDIHPTLYSNDEDNYYYDCENDDESYYSYINIVKTKCFIVNKDRYYIIDSPLFKKIEYQTDLLITFVSFIDTIFSLVAVIIISIVFIYCIYILYLLIKTCRGFIKFQSLQYSKNYSSYNNYNDLNMLHQQKVEYNESNTTSNLTINPIDLVNNIGNITTTTTNQTSETQV